MLVLSRKIGQQLIIGDSIRITINRIGGSRVTLGIEAPDDVRVVRGELEAIVNAFAEEAVVSEDPTVTAGAGPATAAVAGESASSPSGPERHDVDRGSLTARVRARLRTGPRPQTGVARESAADRGAVERVATPVLPNAASLPPVASMTGLGGANGPAALPTVSDTGARQGNLP